MKSKVQKWGNDLAIRIPHTIAVKAGLAVGDVVEMDYEDGKVIIQSCSKSKYRLKDLVDAITDENLHDIVGTGEPVGLEAS